MRGFDDPKGRERRGRSLPPRGWVRIPLFQGLIGLEIACTRRARSSLVSVPRGGPRAETFSISPICAGALARYGLLCVHNNKNKSRKGNKKEQKMNKQEVKHLDQNLGAAEFEPSSPLLDEAEAIGWGTLFEDFNSEKFELVRNDGVTFPLSGRKLGGPALCVAFDRRWTREETKPGQVRASDPIPVYDHSTYIRYRPKSWDC